MVQQALTRRSPTPQTASEHVPEAQLDKHRLEPTPWRFSPRGIAIRLFLTCWLIYAMHWATDVVREIYPALALGDHFSFRVDEYANLHPDLFEKPGYGWHINNNPGVSMIAAIPYALARPLIGTIVDRVQSKRLAAGQTEPPEFHTSRRNARQFYAEAWRRGLDVKLGLAALVTQWFLMAPVSALSVVAMFYLLRHVFKSDRTAVWLALLYAFGTPVFFRTGFLNQNLMLGQIAFLGLLVLWDPSGAKPASRARSFAAGVAGGTALLFDYSGVILLLGLFMYAVFKRWQDSSLKDRLRHGSWYVVGSLPPILLLWLYQWRSFGNPFLPPQHWMPPVHYIDQGYQGFTIPQPELLWDLLFSHQFGLFVCAPVLLLALACPLISRAAPHRLSRLEEMFLLLLFVALWLFFGANSYTHLQANTGIRYMTAIVPFLFVPAAVVLMRLKLPVVYAVGALSITVSWSLAMYRQVIGPLGVLDPLLRLFTQGFALPALTTLAQTNGQYGDYFSAGVSPLPLFGLCAVVLYGVWSVRINERVRRGGT